MYPKKSKAPRNRSLTIGRNEQAEFRKQILTIDKPVKISVIENRTICGDIFDVADFLPEKFVDLMFIDPPYNLNKRFNGTIFRELTIDEYEGWIDSWLSKTVRLLKPDASIYICGDWRSSSAIYNATKKCFKIQNRITFEREKGRGAKANWKSCSEDIWFCTMSNKYFFNVEAVKMKRKVIAPYRDISGKPKDWHETDNGQYRITYPSNIWTDITIPFWSMPENTEHPTQKPEKLLAKIILASSKEGDFVFDPFLGSGTTSVVAKKLGRRFLGIEIDEQYCLLAGKRLALADQDKSIQGYADSVFWERNTLREQKSSLADEQPAL